MADAPEGSAGGSIKLQSEADGGQVDVKAVLTVPQQLPLATILHKVIVESVCCGSHTSHAAAPPSGTESIEVGSETFWQHP